MGRNMGLDFGLQGDQTCFKRKFRWLFIIPGISADSGVQSLPPSKASRPNFGFKETAVEHLNETIYIPTKTEWKTIDLTLFDLKRQVHPVFKWITTQYDPKQDGKWYRPGQSPNGNLKLTANLLLYDGCGNTIENGRLLTCGLKT